MFFKANIGERNSVQLYSDVGMGEIFVARLMYLREHVLNGVCAKENSIDWETVKDNLWQVIFNGLSPAFSELRMLHAKGNDPKFAELEKMRMLKAVISNLVVAIKEHFQKTVSVMGYSMGFLFQKDQKFEKGLAEFQAFHPNVNSEFIDYLRRNRKWIYIMIDTRNDIIDHPKPLSEVKNLYELLSEKNVKILFDNCWRFIEDCLIVFTADLVDQRFGMQLLELEEYQQNKNSPQRVGWFFKEASLKPAKAVQ